ncbi:Nucleoside diphosphate kinase 7 [Eumeta japonica]|uniref:Nucleoside diphosphate kinase 7 n=1 Tax=Eumeta variegata TaxID=151549 RepID=A0A4C1VMS8_EUMVA|nr:Nucleoside diphosphate kinase 7 [Eumeta japonica]
MHDAAFPAPRLPILHCGLRRWHSDPVSRLTQICADLEYFFPPPTLHASRLHLTATLSNSTLCIIKPHIVRDGTFGKVMSAIDEGGFDVTACNMLIVDSVNAAEFYEVYKGIVTEYQGMVEELSSGACIAMEVTAKDKNVNSAIEFRKLVGPPDPEIARLLRPHTLRAKFGKTKVQNAVHCSDLAEDGLLEVEYFFKILSV